MKMDHVVIMKKSWDLIPRILDGKKVVESRWYKTRRKPWNKVQKGDNLYFKNSGESVFLRTRVTKVVQYQVDNDKHAINIMKRYAKEDLGSKNIPKEVLKYITNKKYAIFVFFDNVKKVKPFNIDKKGFGVQSAWLTVEDINKIKCI